MQYLIQGRKNKTAFKNLTKPYASRHNAHNEFGMERVTNQEHDVLRLVRFNPRTNETVVLERSN